MLRQFCCALVVSALVLSTAHAVVLTDDTGDAADYFGAGVTPLDLQTVTVTPSAQSVHFDLAFTTAPDPFAFGGYIDLDTDMDPSTGSGSHLDDLGLLPPFEGVDYYLEMTFYSVNLYKIGHVETQIPTNIDLAYTGNSVSFDLPLSYGTPPTSLISGSSFGMITTVGNYGMPTDYALDGQSFFVVDVPEPASALLVLVGLLGIRRRSNNKQG